MDPVSGLTKNIVRHGHQIRIQLNCAGVQKKHPSHQSPSWIGVRSEQFIFQNPGHSELEKQVIQIDLTSVLTLHRDVGAHMLERKSTDWGRDVACLLSYQGGITVAPYAASKGGVAQLTWYSRKTGPASVLQSMQSLPAT